MEVSIGGFEAHEGEAVAEGEDDSLKAGMTGDDVVEVDDGGGLRVGVGDGVEDFAVPEGVVGDDESAVVEAGEEQVEIAGIVALVGVDVDQVEGLDIKRGDDVEGVADVEDDVGAAGGGGGKEIEQTVFHLVVDFDGVERGSRLHSLGEAEGRVAGECP